MIRRIFLGSFIVVVFVAGAACSSSSSNNGGGTGTCGNGSVGGGSANAACNTCVSQACSSQIQSCESGACSAWVNGGCKGVPDQGCQTCAATIEQCQSANCAAQCSSNPGQDAGSETSSGGNCAALAACCNDPAMPADQKANCEQAVTGAAGNDTTCGYALTGYRDAKYCK